MFVDSSAIKIVQDTITVTRAEMIDQARAGTRLMAASNRRTKISDIAGSIREEQPTA